MDNKTVERLNELLEAKDEKIEELEATVQQLEREVDGSKWGWRIVRAMKDVEELPIPRLELVASKLLWEDGSWSGDYEWVYRLVYRHLTDELISCPLGHTKVGGGSTQWPPTGHDGRLTLPRRDGCHIYHDAAHLKLPAFARCDDIIEPLGKLGDYERQYQVGKEHRRDAGSS